MMRKGVSCCLMRKFLGNYNPIYTRKFDEQINGVSKDYRQMVENKIEDLIADPWHNTRFLKGQYRGKRKLRLTRKDRLVFVICEECRELNHTIYNKCNDCDSTPEDTLVIGFIIFGHRY